MSGVWMRDRQPAAEITNRALTTSPLLARTVQREVASSNTACSTLAWKRKWRRKSKRSATCWR